MAQRRRKSNGQSYMGQMINTGVGNLVGVGMIGATSSTVQAMPAGTAKDIAGIVPGLQATSMLGPNLKMVNASMGMKQSRQSGPRRMRMRRQVRRPVKQHW